MTTRRWPPMPIHDCTDCDGQGRMVAVDYDEFGEMRDVFVCEGCQGSGRLTSCRECTDVMPLPEAEQNSYRCPTCIAAEEYGGRERAIEDLRRM